jgi:hypothetical protein
MTIHEQSNGLIGVGTMKRVHYAGQNFLTGDSIADALMEYATMLARRARADRVDVPVMADGRIQRMAVVLGPASQILAEPVDNGREDPVDEELIGELRRRTALLRSPRPIATRGLSGSATEDVDPRDDLLE